MIDLTGQKFGYWTVLRLSEKRLRKSRYWWCSCECKTEQEVATYNLTSGKSQSCGCHSKDVFHAKRRFGNALDAKWYRRFARHIYCAKQRGVPAFLTDEQFKTLCSSPCHYCGGFSKSGINGVDRSDSTKGYQLENCVSCCSTCNTAKLSMSVEEFAKWIVRVYRHFIK